MNPATTDENMRNISGDKEASFKMPTMTGIRLNKRTIDEEHASSTSKTDLVKNEPFSPAEGLKQLQVNSSFNYREPTWGGIGENSDKYKLEVIKDGTKIDDISLKGKSMYVFGRLQSCDHQMDHPSISRFHAVFQYRLPKDDDSHEESLAGWYLYDLDSTHGTWVNKQKIKSEVFVRLRVGYVIKFGGSSRLFVMDGPPEDCDQETEMSFAEMTRMKNEAKLALSMKEMAESEDDEKQCAVDAFRKRNEFCSWGLDDDAVDEDPDGDNPFAEPSTDESLYLDDPKKSIKGFFEREGLDAPDYQFIDDDSTFGIGSRKCCRLELPVDSPNGKPVYAEVPVDGKRKEAMVACALEACRMLDKLGLLRQATHESRSKRKKRNWAENDYYDSDEDCFFDRTGDLEKKREKRMKREQTEKPETHESLMVKLENVIKEMTEIENSLADNEKMNKEAVKEDDEECDELDAFMKTVKLGGLGVRAKMTMKSRLTELRHLKAKLESLVAIAKPCEIKINPNPKSGKKGTLGMFGKMTFSKLNLPKSEGQLQMRMPADEQVEVEHEEEEENDINLTDVSDNSKMTKIGASNDKDVRNKMEKEELHSSNISVNETLKSTSKASSPKQIKNKSHLKKGAPSSGPQLSKSVVYGPKRDLPEQKDVACPDESSWLPPADQIGDGRTKLNEKFGY